MDESEDEIGRPDYQGQAAHDPLYDAYAVTDDPYADPGPWNASQTARSGSKGGDSLPESTQDRRRDTRQHYQQGSPAPESEPAAEPRPAAEPPSWGAFVIDQAIVEFEPKPPRGGYIPDTEFDGWSTEHARVRLASVRGYSHRYYGKPRQDHVEATVHQQTAAVMFAVADGVSSAEHAEIGARLACEASLAMVAVHLDAERPPDWNEVLHAAANRLISAASRRLDRPADPVEVETLFATTLVVGMALPAQEGLAVSIASVGDSGAWVLKRERYRPVLGVKDDPASAVVSSAVQPLPRVPDLPAQARFTLKPGEILLVGTDGFGDPLGNGEGELGLLFARWLSDPPPARGLAHLLDFSRETFDDDRTLLALWPLASRAQEPR